MFEIPAWAPAVYQMLHGSPQDPQWHAEGDVAVHTRMVVEALVAQPSFYKLSPFVMGLLYRAALLHDIGKPSCTQVEDGHIRNHGHSRKGAVLARGVLYGEGYAPAGRESICTLVRMHMTPVHAADTEDSDLRRRIIRGSAVVPMGLLLLLAKADNKGRKSLKRTDNSEFNIEYFSELVSELNCSEGPYAFSSDLCRFLYHRGDSHNPAYEAYDATVGTMYMMSGLPGSGKDTWIKKHMPELPVVSLDDLRLKMGVEHGANQSKVINAAREQAKIYLRLRQNFVFNATNIVEDLRLPWIQLAHSYNFRTHIHYMEVPYLELLRRNKTREADKQVPVSVINKMIDRWSVPQPGDAHKVTYLWSTP